MPVLVVLRKIQRKAIPRIVQPQSEGCVHRGLGQRTNKQKPHLFQGSGCNQKLAASALPMCPSAQAFAADSYSDLLVFLLDMNNAPFVIDSVFISLSLIKGAYH